MQQLWAQVKHCYERGETYWLTKNEEEYYLKNL